MPAVSRSQQRLFGAAEHGADFPEAENLRNTMSHQQLHDFASGPETGKPDLISLIRGATQGVMGSNMATLKNTGLSEADATRQSIGLANSQAKPKGHPNRHKNLGKFLHPKKA